MKREEVGQLGEGHGGKMASNRVEITPALPCNHEIEGHSNVTRPPLPPRLHRLSELVDPAMLPDGSHVRSPSGTIYTPEAFRIHPDRPRSIRERQENIREKVKQVRAVSRLAQEGYDGQQDSKSPSKGKTKGKDQSMENLTSSAMPKVCLLLGLFYMSRG